MWLIVIIMYFPTTSAEWCLWECEQPPKWYEKLFSYTTSMLWHIAAAWYELIVLRTMLFITVIISGLLFLFLLLMIKGRHRTLATKTKNNTTAVKTNIFVTGGNKPTMYNNPSAFIIPTFNGTSDVRLWITRLECWFEAMDIPHDEWLVRTFVSVDENCLKRIEKIDEIGRSETGYEDFKKSLIEIFF